MSETANTPLVVDLPLPHERLDAYQLALQLLATSHALVQRLPRAKGQIGDQLARAAESVVLRIAEGAGLEWRSLDQRRHYRAARGSALECAAVFDVCRIRQIGDARQWQAGRELVQRIVQVLSRLGRER